MVPLSDLPAATRSAGRLDAMIARVADHVGERILDQLEHLAVELGLLAVHDEIDLLAEVLAARRGRCAGSFFQAEPIGCMRVFITASCSSAVMPDRRCSGALNSLSFEVRSICISWLRVSTSSETIVIRLSSTSTLTRIVLTPMPRLLLVVVLDRPRQGAGASPLHFLGPVSAH